MSVIFIPKDKKVLLYWVSELDKVWSTLNEWETKFVAGLSFKISRNEPISEKQQTALERIYANKTK
jgi:hypothetical protein